ncbi:MAG: winged helix-turn-helix transcriptional regulator [Alistipes sp.]|nr:winged helix-turn-helix transcriptional regulator [Alistipes sp.]MBR6550664.1 winged helix-turn-helix transcriptional regulator [Paludibacteraceae bacterium]
MYLISENPRITTRKLVDIIGIHERNVARNLKTLQERGFLRRIGGRKEGYWQVVTQ